MEDSLYQTPKSDLIEDEYNKTEFYVVSIKKLLFLYFSTMGMYHLYWFYKNWALYAKKNGEKMWPVMRSIFSIFFAHALFRLVNAKSEKVENDYEWDPSGVATIYVIFTIVGNITDRLAMRSIGEPVTDFVGILVLPVIGWSIYKAQKVANIACNDPAGDRNSQLSPINYFWILIGSILWLLIGIGLYDLTIGIPEFS